MIGRSIRRLAAVVAFVLGGMGVAGADTTPQNLPFSQAWTNTGLITISDDWNGVPGIIGYRGDALAATTGVDPQTILVDGTSTPIDVNANQTLPNTFTTGGVTEFELTDATIALAGSGTARAPFILLNLNTTGASGVNVAYRLRDLETGADNAIQPVALHYRVGNSGSFTNVPAAFVADATAGPNVAGPDIPVSVSLPAAADNQPLVQVRIMTSDAVGNDEWVGVDDIVVSTAPVGNTLAINDVAVAEGNAGTTTFSFTVSLSAPAGAGGVSFDIATADGTATLADNDYVQRALTGQTIAAGNSTYTFDVSVNGDLTNEPNETFFVNVTNVTGATVADGQGQGTINNDDTPLTPIHDIQGPGAASPLLGQVVVTRGVVTVRVNNGFYFQTADAEADADPNTSQGMFAFTSSAPPAAAAVGNLVQVSGTVAEFVPPTDPNQQPLTQLTTPTTILLISGVTLPTPVTLTTTLPSPALGVEQLERLENMRVTAPSFTITGATGGSVNEPNATSTTNGRFYGVVTGTPRPFRESGLEPEDAVGQPATIPRWDGNPERINFESLRARDAAGVLRTPIDVDAGQTVSGLTGVIDYAFRNWRFTIDFDAVPVVSGSAAPVAVSAATPAEYTVASYNLQRFFDDTNDPALGEPVLTPAAFANRLAKASRGIREFLRTPDILGIVEIEDLATLQTLANRINADAVAAGDPDPQYQAFLSNGTDPGGIDVGFLVKSAPVSGSTPRVAVNSVTQFGLATLLKCPDGSDNVTGERLNDRPPLLLDAVVSAPNGASAPVVVIVNHSRSLGNATSTAAPPVGPCPVVNFATEGDRVRRKRQQQAEFLANLVQSRQVANPNENLVVVGDFNAFEFNDGLGDSIGVISGTPAPDNETVVPADGIDLVNPDLGNLIAGVAAPQRYSYVFDGDAQNLDHALVNATIASGAAPVRLEHARINADFAEDNRGDTTVPLRLSDHDPAVAYFSPAGFGLPDALFANGFEDPPPP